MIRSTGKRRRGGYVIRYKGKAYHGVNSDQIIGGIIADRVRAQQILAPGWEDEVMELLLESYPRYFSRFSDKEAFTLSVSSMVTFGRAIISRLQEGVVAPDVAHNRASICAGCPHAIPFSGCSKCRTAAKAMWKSPEPIQGIEEKGCGICGCMLSLAVWATPETLATDKRELSYPSHCWKQELSEGDERNAGPASGE